MEQINQKLAKKLSKTTRLPVLPNAVNHLLAALFDDDIDFRKLTKIIQQYPSISARLLSLANSAWSAPVTPIATVENACARLGFNVIRNVSIALTLSEPFNPRSCPLFNAKHFWTTSMLVADGAALLASGLEKKNFDDDMEKTTQTVGIIHSLGLLWLAENMSNETGQALKVVSKDSALTVSQALNDIVGFDYCEVGYWLAQEWGLPRILSISIRYHRNSHYHGEFWEVSHLVGAAAMMAGTLCKGDDTLPEIDFLEQLEISSSYQEQVFSQLAKKLDKTRELVKILFN